MGGDDTVRQFHRYIFGAELRLRICAGRWQACSKDHELDLVCLFLLGSGVQFSVLRKLGFTLESLRQHIIAVGPGSEQPQAVCGFAVGTSAARALSRAAHEAAGMSHTYTGTEHLLLGLLSEPSGGAAELFATHKVNIFKARRLILDEYAQV